MQAKFVMGAQNRRSEQFGSIQADGAVTLGESMVLRQEVHDLQEVTGACV
jgi:hypothetical protein